MRQVPKRRTFRQILPFFSVIIIDVMSFGIIIPVLAPLVAKTTSGFFAHHDTAIARHLFNGMAIVLSLVYSKQLQSPNIKVEVDHSTPSMIPLTMQSDNE